VVLVKKAEMSMSVIIAAAIALLILIILAVLILRAGSGVTEGTGCKGVGGTCFSSCDDLADEKGGTYVQNLPNSGKSGICKVDEACCVTLLKGEENP
jgi:hypothetical protein